MKYMDVRPSRRMVRTQKEVLDLLIVGTWLLKEDESEYQLIHHHPRFGQCTRRVPMKLVSRMIDKDLLDYAEAGNDQNPYLVPGSRVYINRARRTWEVDTSKRKSRRRYAHTQ